MSFRSLQGRPAFSLCSSNIHSSCRNHSHQTLQCSRRSPTATTRVADAAEQQQKLESKRLILLRCLIHQLNIQYSFAKSYLTRSQYYQPCCFRARALTISRSSTLPCAHFRTHLAVPERADTEKISSSWRFYMAVSSLCREIR